MHRTVVQIQQYYLPAIETIIYNYKSNLNNVI